MKVVLTTCIVQMYLGECRCGRYFEPTSTTRGEVQTQPWNTYPPPHTQVTDACT